MFLQVQKELEEFKSLLGTILKRQLSLEDKMNEIQDMLTKNKKYMNTKLKPIIKLETSCDNLVKLFVEKNDNVKEVDAKFEACRRGFEMCKIVLESVCENQDDITGLVTRHDFYDLEQT